MHLSKILPDLKWLNHLPREKFLLLEKEEKITNEISDELLKENCKIMQSKTLDSIDWKLSIESVNLTHMKISSMRGLEELVNLREINLSNNQISCIRFIENCKLL